MVGIASQFVSDLVTSVIEGELSFSHWSSYAGAAAGGAIAALIPGGGVLADMVGSAVSTVVGALSYNAESAILGREEKFGFEEIFYNTVNDTLLSAAGGFLFDNSKVGSLVPSKKIPKLNIGLDDFARGTGVAILDGIKNSRLLSYPNTHMWNSPNVERIYFSR